ncbi:SusC/RagA family TonB-linked outer membrane protein [Flavobacterium sp. CHNK8]|uniref:SusC/RagA family TonB-linked outer membrane protein n=1 Tax=Flavobacterium sp. CHNK8 TaxID=2871165 RepID=UPI001C8D252B|nr:SusC/RagA family TonB-linked outer membrane protein [Flavobacterium sp. CHNK8]QZK91161.1 SusC/RagA family TonB-linked outer membrane protein [Flavobacterium sp. CHNK8]
MKSKFTWIMTLCLAFFIQFSFAQEKTVSGTVTSKADQMTMPGVNVVVQGTKRGVQTDFNGGYAIKASVGERLVFSIVGSKTVTVVVGGQTRVNVQLEDDNMVLENVIVEGYNVTKTKAKSNVASVTVSAQTIEGRPNASFIQTLQAQVAGLNITSGTGQPGGNSQVIIRGTGSINGKVEPLFVIDGIPLNNDNFRSINPDDIESVSVLKDAGATSIYGNRGANGVIIVKTKKGNFDSPLSVKYTSTTGFSTLQKTDYNLMNAQELLTTERAFGRGRGFTRGPGGGPMTDAQIAAAPNTNWNKYFFRTGVTQNHVVSISGGGKNATSFTSLGYFDQQGILKGSDLKRFSFRNNLTGKSNNDKFAYATTTSLNFSRRNEANAIGTGGVNQNYVLGANNSAPYISPNEYSTSQQLLADYNAQGGTLLLTPLFLIDKLKTFQNRLDELKGLVNLDGSYKITRDLTLGTALGLDYTQGNSYTWQSPTAFNTLLFSAAATAPDTENQFFERDLALSSTTRLNFNRSFNEKHTINAGAYLEYIKSNRNAFTFTQRGLNPKTTSPGAGTGYILDGPADDRNVPTVSASRAVTGLLSYFGNVDYDYDSKYGFGASIRRDASSRFAEDYRWGTFYSLSGRWNIDKEAFMQGSVFNGLKLRGSYGTSGNQDISNGVYLALNNTRELYTTGTGYNGTQSFILSQLAVPDLQWETTAQANVGVDFEIFKSRLRGSFDVYRKKTTDLFLSVPLSGVNATTGISKNFGALKNEGVEATLNYDLFKADKAGDFNMTLNFNGSYNKNTILDVAGTTGVIDNTTTVIQEGRTIDEFFLTRYAGVNPANGNLLFLTASGQVTENPNITGDRVLTGKSRIPLYQGGFGFNTKYKGFYFDTNFSFAAEVYRIDFDLQGLQNPTNNIGVFNVSADLLNAWTPTNRVTDIPSLKATNYAAQNNSDRYLVDASYVRLRFASFGYDVPKKQIEKTPFKSVRIFVQGENLVTFTKWRGWDAESPRTADQYQYPTPKLFSVGLQLEF